jgi:hypothetical protein
VGPRATDRWLVGAFPEQGVAGSVPALELLGVEERLRQMATDGVLEQDGAEDEDDSVQRGPGKVDVGAQETAVGESFP